MDLSVFLSVLPSICSDFPRTITSSQGYSHAQERCKKKEQDYKSSFPVISSGMEKRGFLPPSSFWDFCG